MPGAPQKIAKLIDKASYSQDRYQVFSDCVAAMALSISNAVDRAQYDKREQRYMEIVGRYDDKRIIRETFPKIMAEVTMALEDHPQDVLGATFHELELHNKARGQFFTPYSLCQMMAEMTFDEKVQEEVKSRGFITVHEPCVGSGAMVIALAEAMQKGGCNYQQQLHVTAIDIDPRAVHMAYTQLSVMGVPAEVTVGNTLSMEMRESFYTPAHVMDGWDMRLRMQQGIEQAKTLDGATGDQDSQNKADSEWLMAGSVCGLVPRISVVHVPDLVGSVVVAGAFAAGGFLLGCTGFRCSRLGYGRGGIRGGRHVWWRAWLPG